MQKPDTPPVTFDEYKKFLDDYSPEKAEAISGCSAELIRKAAMMFAEKGKATISMWTMGLNQRTSGVAANNLVHNLHLLTGKIGLPGSTPLSLTGQPNACGGIRDGGALSHLLPYGRLIANEGHRKQMEELWGVPAGTIQPKPGLTTVDLFGALAEKKIKALLILCTNPAQSMPNLNKYNPGLKDPDTFVVVSEAYFPTRTAELADVVLPSAAWSEKEGVYGCTERRYQLLDKAVEPQGESRTDFAILKDLATRLGHGKLVDFKNEAEAWSELMKCSKGTAYDFTGMTRERLKNSHGLLWPLPSEGHPGTKRRYVRGEDPLVKPDHPQRIHFYGRPDGKAWVWLRPHKLAAEMPDAEYPFVFTTGRVLEHWHTSTMTGAVPELQKAVPQAVAEINPADAKKLGISSKDKVKITSRRGSVVLEAKVVDVPRPGLIFSHMHDQETTRMINFVTNDATDPISRQPEFKVCAVKVQKA
ncbi:MAG: molybdopterin-dependent oxidoreductase, partial [Ignavibacteriae bacterium]|nr:molybdopterin-dependent oxidoreductase [Ignavibacteriota bacterium]